MKKILIISFSDLSSDPRVDRQINFLFEKYEIITCGYKSSNIPQLKHINYIKYNKLKSTFNNKIQKAFWLLMRQHEKYEKYYWDRDPRLSLRNELNKLDVDLVIANDLAALPIATDIKKNAKLLFDAHEYSPRQFEDRLFWNIFFKNYKKYLCKQYINKVDAMITVSKGIADEYEKNYGISPTVITNATQYYEIRPQTTDPNRIRIIHHGIASPSRKIEKMIEMMDYLDARFCFDLMLMNNNPRYYNKLVKKAKKHDRIHFLDPVSMNDIISVITNYDIGLFLVEPVNFNLNMVLPNKLFEFIQARLAVAIGPSPEMKRIVKRYDCGIIAEDFSARAMAEALLKLDYKKIDYYKEQSGKAAKNENAENNKATFLNIVNKLIG